jgi:hypothetical protein
VGIRFGLQRLHHSVYELQNMTGKESVFVFH